MEAACSFVFISNSGVYMLDSAETYLQSIEKNRQQGNLIEAQKDIEKLKGVDPKSARFPQALIYIDKSAYSHAEPILVELLAEMPKVSVIAYNLALCLYHLGHREKAEQLLAYYFNETNLESCPPIYLLLAKLYLQKLELLDAIQCIRGYLAQTPDCPKALGLLALVTWQQGEFTQSKLNYQKALKINPNQQEALLAECLTQIFDLQHPSFKISDAILTHKKNDLLWFSYGVILLVQGHFIESEQAIKTALELDKRSALYWQTLGLNYLAQKNFNNATLCFEKTMVLHPDEPDSQVLLSICKQLNGDPTQKSQLLHNNFDETFFASPLAKKIMQTLVNDES